MRGTVTDDRICNQPMICIQDRGIVGSLEDVHPPPRHIAHLLCRDYIPHTRLAISVHFHTQPWDYELYGLTSFQPHSATCSTPARTG
jgi:hypothetical protein